MDGASLEIFFEKHAIELPKLLQDTLGYKISTKVSDGLFLSPPEEIGDGNLNVVYRVFLKPVGTVIVKYAPAYIKVLGPGHPLTQDRLVVEYAALEEYHRICQGCVPIPVMFDIDSSAFIMEDLREYEIMRKELMAGHVNADVVKNLMTSIATIHSNTLMEAVGTDRHQQLCKTFCNEDMVTITEQYIFTYPFLNGVETNRHHQLLNKEVESLRNNEEVCHRAEEMKKIFIEDHQCLCHGDLHTGSAMVSGSHAKMFDMEFAFMGPATFDFGMFVANLLFALVRHNELGNHDIVDSIKSVVECAVTAYCLAVSDRILGEHFVSRTCGFIGCELIRRVIGAAHVEDIKEIPKGEMVAVQLGQAFLLQLVPTRSVDTDCSSKTQGHKLLEIIKALLSEKL